MTLATADAAGRPSARTVAALKARTPTGSASSRTRRAARARAGGEPERGARLPLAAAAATAGDGLRRGRAAAPRGGGGVLPYRPLGSRLGAWASRQTTVIVRRDELDHAFAEAEAAYGDDPPLPPWWGGYLLRPERLEGSSRATTTASATTSCTTAADGSWLLSGWRPDAARWPGSASGASPARCRPRRGSSPSGRRPSGFAGHG